MGQHLFTAENLSQKLISIAEKHHITGMKSGTEVEDMDFDEIAFMREITRRANLTLTIKIGGPEARNDIRQCVDLGIDIILAPMIESVYAIDLFVDAATEIISEKRSNKISKKNPSLAFNIETITAMKNFDAMLLTEAMSKIDAITLGRSDFSRSMHLDPDDNEVLRRAELLIRKINNKNKVSSMGGAISMANIRSVIARIHAQKINTRHIVFQNSSEFQKNPEKHLYFGLQFEKELYQALSVNFPHKSAHYGARISTLDKRIGNFHLVEKATITG